MTTRNTDVNLIIRAKTEGEKAVAGLGDILETLFDESRRGSGDIAELGKTLGLLDKAASSIVGSMDKASGAVERQRASIAANNNEYKALAAQRSEALAVLAKQNTFVGPRTQDGAKQYQGIRAEVERLDIAIARLFNQIEQQNAQLNSSQSGLLKLSSTYHAVADGQAVAAAQMRATTDQLDKQTAAAQKNAGALNAIGRSQYQDSGKSAALSAGVFQQTGLTPNEREAAQASALMDREAQQLRATLNPLAAIQERFNAALERYKVLATAGKISTAEFAAAEAHLATEAETARAALSGGGGTGNQKIGLFGLKPYELQNFSYQVNDVVTGLASGQRATQVIAQQGGQILQLFPKVAGNIIGALKNPYIAAAVVTVGALAFALKNAADNADRLREYTTQLSFRADGGSYDAKSLATAEQGLQHLGATASDARGAIKTFLDEGIAPDRINQFGRAAEEASRILGIKLPDAAKQVADAFTGGYKAVADLDDKMNFLTATEREHIRQLFEEGQAQAARTEALNAFTQKADAAAQKQRGSWGEAAHALGGAWDALIKTIANSLPIQVTIGVLNQLADALAVVGGAISKALPDDASTATGGNAAAHRIAQVQAQIHDLEKSIVEYDAAIAKKSPISGTLRHLVDGAEAQLAQAKAELAKLEKNVPDTLNNNANSPQAKQRADELAKISAEDELQRLRDAGQVRLLTAAEKARREELAGHEAARLAGDSVVAAAEKRRAVAHETAQIEKESDARAKAAAADREREIRQYETRVVGAEGGAAKNPHSSASGYGQFTEGTFKSQFAKVFPQQARELSSDQILELRKNETVAKAIIDNYARENAKFLESFGAKVTAGNLYLAHFLGAGGAKAVLTAPSDRPVDQILRRLPNAAQVLSGNQGYLRTDGGKSRYRTAGELQSFIANRVGDRGTAQTEGQVAINKLLDDAKQKQEDFNLAVRQGAEDQQRTISALTAEAGLHDVALIAEQRRQAIVKAADELRQKVEDTNKSLKEGQTAVVVSQAQIDKTKELAGALFDVQHAKDLVDAQHGTAQRSLDTLSEQRDLLIQQRDLLMSMGEFKTADQVQIQIVALGGKIQDAYDKLIKFYKALSPDDRVRLGIVDDAQLDNLIEKLQQAKDGAQALNGTLLHGTATYRQFLDAFASSAAEAFTNFIQNVAAGKNVFKSFAQGVVQFAASFAAALAQMIIKALAFTAALYALSAITHIPVQVLAAGAQIAAGVHHSGGIAGSAGGVQRSVNPAVYAGAMRYHTGGIAGFMPDEVPAILRRGEEVLTESDPRHRANGGVAGGGGNGSTGSVKLVNVFDPAVAIEQALSTTAGEKVLLNFVSKNPRAFKAAMGG